MRLVVLLAKLLANHAKQMSLDEVPSPENGSYVQLTGSENPHSRTLRISGQNRAWISGLCLRFHDLAQAILRVPGHRFSPVLAPSRDQKAGRPDLGKALWNGRWGAAGSRPQTLSRDC
jgi:hypothetical protein